MCDALHYIMERDLIGRDEEVEKQINSLRSSLYRDLYGRERYRPAGDRGGAEWGPHMASMRESDPTETKPFIEATPMNPDAPLPFGNVLDAPLG